MKVVLPAMALSLAGCASAGVGGDEDIRAATLAFYAPYQMPSEPPADWDRQIYTADTAVLIDAWRAVRADGEPVDGLSDAGWLCECQDWDAAAFEVTIDAITRTAADRARISLTLRQGWGAQTTQVLLLRQEGGRWLIDDLFTDAGDRGLRNELREAAQ